MPLVQTVATPWVRASSGTATSANITVPAGALVIAHAASGTSTATTTFTVTDSSGMAWTQGHKIDKGSTAAITAGAISLWYVRAASARTITVAASHNVSGPCSVQVLVFTGATTSGSPFGTLTSNYIETNGTSVAMTSTAIGSRMYAAMTDYWESGAVAGANTEMVQNLIVASSSAYSVLRRTADSSAIGQSLPIAWTQPNWGAFVYIAYEVLASATAPSLTATPGAATVAPVVWTPAAAPRLTVAPGIAISSPSAPDPTATLRLTATPGVAVSSPATSEPTAMSRLTAIPGAAVSNPAALAPVARSAITVAPDPASVGGLGSGPFGEIPFGRGGATAYAPVATVTSGAVPDLAASTPAAHAPTATTRLVASPGTADSAPAVLAPMARHVITVTPGVAPSAPMAPEPTVTLGPVTATPGLAVSIPVAYEPRGPEQEFRVWVKYGDQYIPVQVESYHRNSGGWFPAPVEIVG